MGKRTIFSAVLLPLIVVAAWSEGKVDTRNEPKADVSYAFGMVLGYDLKETGIAINYDHFGEGLRAAMEGEETKLSRDEAMELIQAAFFVMQQAKMAEDLERGREFLKDNAARDGVRVTESGLQYVVIEEGDGERPGETDVVQVHYEGSLIDGTVFDSSLTRGVPAEIPLDAVIPGWAEGLQLMKVGGHYTLFVPSELGYSEWGAGDIVPPNSVLIFDVVLLGIVREDEVAEEASVPGDEPADEAESGEDAEEALPTDGEPGADNAESADKASVPGDETADEVESGEGAEEALPTDSEPSADNAEPAEEASVPEGDAGVENGEEATNTEDAVGDEEE
jgi:FKBP-type peptidyl-prolyl cis-trans isomerase